MFDWKKKGRSPTITSRSPSQKYEVNSFSSQFERSVEMNQVTNFIIFYIVIILNQKENVF